MTAPAITPDNPLFAYLSMPHWALNMTRRCQQGCVYCSIPNRKEKANLGPEDTRRLLTEASRTVPAVIFMGAEPTMTPELPDLIRFGTDLGLKMMVSTNGLKFSDRQLLQEYVDAGLKAGEFSFPYPDDAAYHRITRAGSQNFSRLLEALDNIEAINAERSAARGADAMLGFNINTVVSRVNVHRLGEVLDHVSAHLSVTPRIVTFKWIEPGGLPDEDYLSDFHVSLTRLRENFLGLLDHWTYPFPVIFRGFPLCAIPGYEHLSANIVYYTEQTDVKCNFEDQEDWQSMHPMKTFGAPYSGFCASCSLESLCFDRGIFEIDPHNRSNRPVPSTGTVEKVLEQLGIEPAEVSGLEPYTRPLLERDRLAASLYQVLSGRIDLPAAHSEVGICRLEAIRDFRFTVKTETAETEFYVGPYREEMTPFYPIPGGILSAADPGQSEDPSLLGRIAGHLIENPILGSTDSEISPVATGSGDFPHYRLLRAAWQTLRHPWGEGWTAFVRTTPPVCRLTVDELGPPLVCASVDLVSGTAEFGVLEPPDDEETVSFPRFLGGSLNPPLDETSPRRFLDDLTALFPPIENGLADLTASAYRLLAPSEEPADRLPFIAGHFGNSILVVTETGRVRPVRLLDRINGLGPTFLCGPVLLSPDPGLLKDSSGSLLARIAGAIGNLPETARMTTRLEDGWHGRLWDLLGPFLLPRSGLRGAVVGGRVLPDRLSLDVRVDGQTVTLVFGSGNISGRQSLAEVEDIRFYYDCPQVSGNLRTVIDAYSRQMQRSAERLGLSFKGP